MRVANGSKVDKRRHARRLSRGALRLNWMEEAGEMKEGAVRVLNVSRDGIQVESPIALPANTFIKINAGLNNGWALVRYCNPYGEGFQVGINLVNGFEAAEDRERRIRKTGNP